MSGDDGSVTEVFSREELASIVDRLASEISETHDDGALLVGVLRGSVVFMADLIRQLGIEVGIDFLSVSAFQPGGERIRILKDLDGSIDGRDVVLVTDLVDTGLTTSFLVSQLESRGARAVSVCALFSRERRRVVSVDIAYRGADIGDRYVVGYGLDHGGRYRNLCSVYAVGRSTFELPRSQWPELE